jgi:hypothetical protein
MSTWTKQQPLALDFKMRTPLSLRQETTDSIVEEGEIGGSRTTGDFVAQVAASAVRISAGRDFEPVFLMMAAR